MLMFVFRLVGKASSPSSPSLPCALLPFPFALSLGLDSLSLWGFLVVMTEGPWRESDVGVVPWPVRLYKNNS